MISIHYLRNSISNAWLVLALLWMERSWSADQYETLRMGDLVYQQLTTPIVTSESDGRSYLGLRLSNKLNVLLVSDPTTEQAATAMDVGVGFKRDPKSMSGLAHFLEHLMFMGNEKYPNDNEYNKYMKSRSGVVNANTAYENTIYFFNVKSDSLDGGLDRFSQNFISPLFKQESVEREANSVDSEHKKNLRSDFERFDQIKRNFSNPEYPYSKFVTGTYETLLTIPRSQGVVTRDIIREFYRKYYSAKRMKLVVIGKESLDELKTMVIPRFTRIPNHDEALPPILGTPFTREHLGVQINIDPVEDQSTMELEFLLPSQKRYYKEKPNEYLKYLFEHEGTNTLTSHLRRLGWITSIEVGLNEDCEEFSTFRFKFDLTPVGLIEINKIMKLVFSYIKLIKSDGISKEFFDELKTIQTKNFRYTRKILSSGYPLSLAVTMRSKAPMSQMIISDKVINLFNGTLIEETLNHLQPNKMRIILITPENTNQNNLLKEPYYDASFSVKRLSSSLIEDLTNAKLDENLSLPGPNPFLTKNFELVEPSSSKFPKLLLNTTGKALWHTTGESTEPKVFVNLLIKNSQWFRSPDQTARLELLIKIIHEKFLSIGYLADQAGINYVIKSEYPGITIKVNGFSEKVSELMMMIIKGIKVSSIDPEIFQLVKDKLVREQKNFKMLALQRTLPDYYQVAMKENTWSNEQLLLATEKLTLDDLVQFHHQSISKGNLEMLVVGNFDESQSRTIFNQVHTELGLNHVVPSSELPQRAVVLEDGHQYIYQVPVLDPNEVNSALVVYYDMYSYTNLKDRTITNLIEMILNEPFFDQIRTKENLGYLTRTYVENLSTQGGIFIFIQSERDPIYLESRINHFLNQFVTTIQTISDQEFQLYINSLRSSLVTSQRSPSSQSIDYWNSIVSGYYDFHHDETLTNHLNQITKSDVIKKFRTLTSNHPKRRKLSIHATSPHAKPDPNLNLSDYGQIIPNLTTWRQRQTLSPIPHPLEYSF